MERTLLTTYLRSTNRFIVMFLGNNIEQDEALEDDFVNEK